MSILDWFLSPSELDRLEERGRLLEAEDRETLEEFRKGLNPSTLIFRRKWTPPEE